MRIYIAGKIGEEVISEATRERFGRAQRMLEKRLSEFSTVINPASEVFQDTMHMDFGRTDLGYEDILLYDLKWLRTCRCIYMLDGWKDSPGAQTEYKYAVATGKKIFFESRKDAVNALWDEFLRKNPEAGKLSLSKGCKLAEEYTEQHIDERYLPVV